jgi:DNA helicase-2/ATP-dependent DNA helicase PcrA
MIEFNGEIKYSAKDIAKALRDAGAKVHDPTPEQAAIIESLHFGPTVVIAGAGSGKTETMSARVLWLVANGIVRPDEILGLTFTRKAAGELASRIRMRLRQLRTAGHLPTDEKSGSSVDISVSVSTYHSYAGRVLSEHGIRMGIDTDAEPIGEAAAWQIANRIVSNFDGSAEAISSSVKTIVGKVMDLSAALGEHGKTVEDIEEFSLNELKKFDSISNAKSNKEAREAKANLLERLAILPMVQAYDSYRKEQGALTFNDQMSYAADLVSGEFSKSLSKEDRLELAKEICNLERSKYKVVILDEYQDTSYSQVRFLSALFGQGHCVTAVGDPNQAIYGWRSASSETLATFGKHFTAGSTAICESRTLLTTWRNDENILQLANKSIDLIAEVGQKIGSKVTEVSKLKLSPKAGTGEVAIGQYESLSSEAQAIAEYFKSVWFAVDRKEIAEDELQTFAVLVRSRKYIPEIEQALRVVGLPVDVIGLGGLIHIPEVADILALVRVLTFPDAGSSLIRLLTGPRLALGAQDLAALGRFARSLVKDVSQSKSKSLVELLASGKSSAMEAEDFAIGSAIEALEVLESADRKEFSEAGYKRLAKFAKELTSLRRQMVGSITDVLIEAERFLFLDTEVLVRDGWQQGRKHLDKFLDEAAKFQRNGGTISTFLDWLKIADSEEGGLKPTSVEANKHAVQILTVHAAKGSEWDYVAVPGLVKKNFPSEAKASDLWTKNIGSLPIALRGDRDQLQDFVFPSPAPTFVEVRKALEKIEDYWKDRRLQEELRLAYVAFTRAKRNLLCTMSWFGEGIEALEPSVLYNLVEDLATIQNSQAVLSKIEKPTGDNPLKENPRTASWPRISPQSIAITRSAELVRSASKIELSVVTADADKSSFISDANSLINEIADRSKDLTVYLPNRISVSTMINLAKDPQELALNIRRPMPNHIDKYARRGTEFHLWVEKQFVDPQIFDEDIFDTRPPSEDELPLKELQEKWRASIWGSKVPVPGGIEVPFETVIGGVLIRGRIDAVYKDGEQFEVVDWKTEKAKSGDDLATAAIQLAMYRLAYSKLYGTPLSKISAAFHYVGSNETIRPADLYSEDQLISIITGK